MCCGGIRKEHDEEGFTLRKDCHDRSDYMGIEFQKKQIKKAKERKNYYT